MGGEIITGKDYLRMAKSESEATSLFRQKLCSAVSGDTIIYVTADPEQVKLLPDGTITLNSSPYGLPFYKANGFVPTDEEKTVNGIRFTPMRYEVK